MEQQTKKKLPFVNAKIVWVLAALALVWYFYGGGMEQKSVNTMQDIQNQLAQDSVERYNITARNGSAVERCAQAAMVSATYLQAKDEANYVKWKAIKDSDCKMASAPK